MKKLLVIGYVWPEPKSSAAGTRMLQLLEFFQSQDYVITFSSTSSPTSFSEDLQKLGISSRAIKLNNSSFDDFLKKLSPDVVLFDRYMMEEQFGWRVDEILPEAIKILDTEDLHFLRKFRETQLKNEQPQNEFHEMDLTKRELGSIFRCDLSLITSQYEYDLLKKDFHISSKILHYIPLLYDPEKLNTEELPHYEDRKDYFFIGNFKHAPNVDCVKFLKSEIWPKLSKLDPKAELHIYGGYPTQQILDFHNKSERFIIKGRTEDASQVFKNYKILLAPLRFGAGLKGKLLEAMYFGVPSITTLIGSEGISEKDWPGVLSDNMETLVKEAAGLYSDKQKWEKSQSFGFSLLYVKFSKKHHFDNFSEEMINLIENLQKRRKQNVLGNLLKFHSNNASRYLSKYIEVKNELQPFKKPPKN